MSVLLVTGATGGIGSEIVWREIASGCSDEGTVEPVKGISAAVLAEAREVLSDAEVGCHLHLHEGDDE